MNNQYPVRLGIDDRLATIGRPIAEVAPKSLMRQVISSGPPILLEMMDFGAESFVVTRLPLRDESGAVVGAVGFILYDDPRFLTPVVSCNQRLRADMADAERKLADARPTKYTFSTSRHCRSRRLGRTSGDPGCLAQLCREQGSVRPATGYFAGDALPKDCWPGCRCRGSLKCLPGQTSGMPGATGNYSNFINDLNPLERSVP